MNKRVAVTFVLVSLIASLFLAFQSVNLARANFIPPSIPNNDPPTLEVQSPQNSTTYTVNSVTLNFTITKPDTWQNNTQIHKISYTLDEIDYSVPFLTNLDNLQGNLPNGDGLHRTTQYSVPYDGLSQGAHSLEIYVEAVSLYSDYSSGTLSLHTTDMEVTDKVYFNIHAPSASRQPTTSPTSSLQPSASITPSPTSSMSPSISILSPENTSYAAVYDPYVHIPLTFETNMSLSWVGYNLDGGSNITVAENGTLIEIPAHSMNLTLYANDTGGNWATPQTVNYFIAFNLGRPPFPTTLVIGASMVFVFVVGLGLLVYFRKRKKRTSNCSHSGTCCSPRRAK